MKKTFDAVEYQQKARKRLGRQYLADPQGFVKRLRRKHGQPQIARVPAGKP